MTEIVVIYGNNVTKCTVYLFQSYSVPYDDNSHITKKTIYQHKIRKTYAHNIV